MELQAPEPLGTTPSHCSAQEEHSGDSKGSRHISHILSQAAAQGTLHIPREFEYSRSPCTHAFSAVSSRVCRESSDICTNIHALCPGAAIDLALQCWGPTPPPSHRYQRQHVDFQHTWTLGELWESLGLLYPQELFS